MKYPNLKSVKKFVASPQYIGDVILEIEGYKERLSGMDILKAYKTAMMSVASHIGKIEAEYEGTNEFIGKPLKSVLRNKLVRFSIEHGDGAGAPQTEHSNEYHMDLQEEEWFIFEDHFGTDEEKAFVKSFKNYLPVLREKYDEIYLVRNERFAEMAIYSFDEGKRFEPDFLLFLKRNEEKTFEQQQVYIEPKGNHLVEIGAEKWKEEFLLQIERKGIPIVWFNEDKRYHIVGMPFFNREKRREVFDEGMKKLLDGKTGK